MRQIGSISNLVLAERFADYLRAAGTACSIDQEGDGYRVWVHDDDQVAAAKNELPLFLSEPDHQRYREAKQRAQARLNADLDRQRATRRRTVNLAEKWSRPVGESCPFTFGLIAFSLIIGYFTGLHPRHNDPHVDWLWFSNDGTLQPILHGEVWRLITPIFVHFGLLHLVFNMMWTQQLGMQIEFRLGTPRFAGMVLVIAILSNFAQFMAADGYFGGMSGVVYGLFGYIWVKAKLEPESGFFMSQQTAIMMFAWFVICTFGWMGSIANWAHGMGLVVGIAFGISGPVFKTFRRRL